MKLTWTTAWRRFNKKIKVDDISKRRTKRTTRIQKAIVGMSLDEIKRRRAEKPEDRDKKIEVAKKEVKERQKQVQKSKQSVRAKQAPPPKAAPKDKGQPKKADKGKRR